MPPISCRDWVRLNGTSGARLHGCGLHEVGRYFTWPMSVIERVYASAGGDPGGCDNRQLRTFLPFRASSSA